MTGHGFQALSLLPRYLEVCAFLSLNQTLIVLDWELRIDGEPYNLALVHTLSGKLDRELNSLTIALR